MFSFLGWGSSSESAGEFPTTATTGNKEAKENKEQNKVQQNDDEENGKGEKISKRGESVSTNPTNEVGPNASTHSPVSDPTNVADENVSTSEINATGTGNWKLDPAIFDCSVNDDKKKQIPVLPVMESDDDEIIPALGAGLGAKQPSSVAVPSPLGANLGTAEESKLATELEMLPLCRESERIEQLLLREQKWKLNAERWRNEHDSVRERLLSEQSRIRTLEKTLNSMLRTRSHNKQTAEAQIASWKAKTEHQARLQEATLQQLVLTQAHNRKLELLLEFRRRANSKQNHRKKNRSRGQKDDTAAIVLDEQE